MLDGKDPAWEKKRKRQDDLDAARATFRKLGDEWLAEHAPLWSDAKDSRVRHRFERDVYPAFGQRAIGEIESTDILRVLRKIEARGSIETAKRARGYIRAVFAKAMVVWFAAKAACPLAAIAKKMIALFTGTSQRDGFFDAT